MGSKVMDVKLKFTYLHLALLFSRFLGLGTMLSAQKKRLINRLKNNETKDKEAICFR